MTELEQSRTTAISNLIAEYRTELGSILDVGTTFDRSRLPPLVDKSVAMIIAKTPSFSTVAALNTVNYAIAHTVCQARVMIDDPVYAKNHIGTNYYGVNLNKSGAGKSTSLNTLVGKYGAYSSALNLVEAKRMESQISVAKELALKEMQSDEPALTMEQVTESNYSKYLKPLTRTTTNAKSSRGGISGVMHELSKEQYGSLSVAIDELGQTIKNGKMVGEVIEILTEVFDMAIAEAPAFKTAELQEQSVEGIYTNLLAQTSPQIIFATPMVKETIEMMMTTAFARRSWFTFSDEDETVENDPIPSSVAEADAMDINRKRQESQLAVEVSDILTHAMTKLLATHDNRLLKFTDEASLLYSRYFGYCKQQAKLLPDSGWEQLEIAGRAWRIGKLAGAWAAASGDKYISPIYLEGAIYFAEWNARYLGKFSKLCKSKPYELLAELFLSNKQSHITLDDAMSQGMIPRVTPTFSDILDPLNSKLAQDGVVQYDQDTKLFTYSKFAKVEPIEVSTCSFTMSYRLVPDLPTKLGRDNYLANFTNFRDDLCYQNLANLLSRNTIFNTFQFTSGATKSNPDVQLDMYRSNGSIISQSNLVVIDIDESVVDLYTVNDFLSNYQHLISTSSNLDNKHKFRIILPVNVKLDGTNTREYAYVTKRICADLLLNPDPKTYCPSQAWYGYEGAEVIQVTEGDLYDVTTYLAEFAQDDHKVVAKHKLVKQRSPKARKAHIDKLMDNIDQVFEYAILAKPGEGSLMLARACLHLIDEGATADELETIINYINNCWDSPMDSQRLHDTLIIPMSSKLVNT